MSKFIRAHTLRRGIALVPVILVVAGLAVFVVALLTAVMSNARTVVRESEDYQVSSSVESVAALAAENLWSQYVAEHGGAAGDIESFRNYLSAHDIDDAGAGGLPPATDGKDMLGALAIPQRDGHTRFNDVNLDAVRLVRRDSGDATQLYLTVSASTTRGEGMVNPVLNRAVQQVYTVEPAEFPGFEYALLANDVNCIFCHARIDNSERWWNRDPDQQGSFERVKVGTLVSLMLRHDADGNTTAVNDADADSFIAGSLYTRGLAMDSLGNPITDWGAQFFRSHPFDADGHIVEDASGLGLAPFAASESSQPLGNLYIDYPLPYAEQGDGYLPDNFPSPFTDDGGVDPGTGEFDTSAAGNRRVDDCEFLEVAAGANGAITAGAVNVTPPGVTIDTASAYNQALFHGNQSGLVGDADGTGRGVQGNVVLTGLPGNPIWINGTLAIDGDLVIQGQVKGTGALYVRGNIYLPTDLSYADGRAYLPGDAPGNPTGPRTFGLAQDGTKNALALTAGGSILIGDFQRPSSVLPNGGHQDPGKFEIVSGDTTGKWNFPLAELSIFNRAEWAKTQPSLPGPNGTTVANPGYLQGYVPRYYGYADGTTIPIFNKGGTYFDPSTRTWMGPETANSWDPSQLTYADPRNSHDPLLYDASGAPRAVVSTITQDDGWLNPSVYKMSVEYLAGHRTQNSPMQIDGLLYTSNAILSILYRDSAYGARMVLNGSIVAADVGMLVPGQRDWANALPNHSPLSHFAIGLQLNYDKRLKNSLNIKNPFQVQLKRTYWNPTANLM